MIELFSREDRLRLRSFYLPAQDTLLLSGLQGHMGRAFLSRDGQSALLLVQGFAFPSGRASSAFFQRAMAYAPSGFLTVSGSAAWLEIAREWGAEESMVRFSLETPAAFDEEKLQKIARPPAGFSLVSMDEGLYRQCLKEKWSEDFVHSYPSYALFSQHAFGIAALKGERIVAGCGTYAHADDSLEIEIGTHPDFRRRGLASACAAQFILQCQKMKKRPHWDAMNPMSCLLAMKLGFLNPRPYPVACREGE